jgi:peptidylprolyl isomerase
MLTVLLLAACAAFPGTLHAAGPDAMAATATQGPESVAGLVEQRSPTGVQFYVLRAGAGASPVPGQTVGVHYSGWLESGIQFDSSVERGKLFVFPVGIGRVIKGWDESVLDMKLGEKRQIHVPPQLGYGENGAGGVIPPGATLIFDVELVELR